MKTTLVFRGDWSEKYVCSNRYYWTTKWSSTSFSYGDFTFCLPVCLVCVAINRSIPSLLSTTFLKDPAELAEQRYLLLLYGLHFRHFRRFQIGMGFTCRDSITRLQKHGKFQRTKSACHVPHVDNVLPVPDVTEEVIQPRLREIDRFFLSHGDGDFSLKCWLQTE